MMGTNIFTLTFRCLTTSVNASIAPIFSYLRNELAVGKKIKISSLAEDMLSRHTCRIILESLIPSIIFSFLLVSVSIFFVLSELNHQFEYLELFEI